MVQQRIYDFGALLTQARTKTLASSLFTPGIYEGFEPTIVSPTLLEFSAGTFLLPNGVLVRETDVTQVTIPTPASAEDYTITADHDDIQAVGGSSAFYTLQNGILEREGDPNLNSLALLWVRHTGGGPLTTDMFSRPPTLQAGTLLAAIEEGLLLAPFPQACDPVLGSNIQVTQTTHGSGNEHLGTLIQNTAVSGLQTYQFRLPLPPRPRPRSIQVFADIPSLASISFDTAGYEMYQAGGAIVSTTPTTIAGPITALDTRAAPAGTFTVGNYDEDDPPISLGVTITVPPATSGFFLKGFNLIGD